MNGKVDRHQKGVWNDIINARFNLASLNLEPAKPIFSNAFAINANIDTAVYSGQVKVRDASLALPLLGRWAGGG